MVVKKENATVVHRETETTPVNYRALHVLCVFRGCKSASMATVPMANHQNRLYEQSG